MGSSSRILAAAALLALVWRSRGARSDRRLAVEAALKAEEAAWARAEEALRSRDEFLASVSHDLRTPLTAIRGHAQLLQLRADRLGPRAPAWLADGLSRIEANANRMTVLINELLDLARTQAGRTLELDARPTDLAELARLVVADYQRVADGHRLRVLAPDVRLVGNWEEARLRRVLENLVSNALKYSPAGTTVTVRLTREELDGQDWAVVSVKDHGIGIPPEEIPRVFDRYYRGTNVATAVPGTGIGLASVQQIAAHHGGTISVESQVGTGSVFTLRLPL